VTASSTSAWAAKVVKDAKATQSAARRKVVMVNNPCSKNWSGAVRLMPGLACAAPAVPAALARLLVKYNNALCVDR